MNRLLMFTILFACAGLSAIAARAEPYWVSYEGNKYPENEGWRRMSFEPLADRYLENGSLVIDASQSGATNEWYEQYPAVVAPEAGEMFIMQWRLTVEMYTTSWGGATVCVFSDDRWALGFDMNNDTVHSAFDPGRLAHYEPGVYHEFEVRTSDMRWYALYIDGNFAFEGPFWESLLSNKIGWGKSTSGIRSITRWDYFRYGVVPEPNTVVLLGTIAGVLGSRSRNRKHN
jgi:hypothetical protein